MAVKQLRLKVLKTSIGEYLDPRKKENGEWRNLRKHCPPDIVTIQKIEGARNIVKKNDIRVKKLIDKPPVKIPHGAPRGRWENNIRVNLIITTIHKVLLIRFTTSWSTKYQFLYEAGQRIFQLGRLGMLSSSVLSRSIFLQSTFISKSSLFFPHLSCAGNAQWSSSLILKVVASRASMKL